MTHRQIVKRVFEPTHALLSRYRRVADPAEVRQVERQLSGLERELVAAYGARDVVEAQALRRELHSIKCGLSDALRLSVEYVVKG